VQPQGDPEVGRQIVRSLAAVIGLATVIGLVIALATAAVVRLSGVLPDSADSPESVVTSDESEEGKSRGQERSASPTEAAPTPTPSRSESPSASNTPRPSRSPEPTRSPEPSPRTSIELDASPSTAGSFEQVTLTGSYAGGAGATLQVQRLEGGSWTAFPTTASVDGETFTTYVELGQPGANQLRVLDPATGRTSNVVVVTIR